MSHLLFTIISAIVTNYKDMKDVCHEWYAIMTLGDFKRGDTYFPELGVKIDCPPG